MIQRTLKKPHNGIRKLNRIFVENAEAFHAELTLEEKIIPCTVVDFHSAGLGLKVPARDLVLNRGQAIPLIHLYYGKKKIGIFSEAVVVSTDTNGRVGITFKRRNGSSVRGVRKKTRLRVDPQFKASALLKDPLRMGEVFHFDLVNMNAQGLLLETSFSNKHILPGMHFDGLQIMLPGLKVIHISGRVSRIDIGDDKLLIGLVFTDVLPEALEALAQFCLFGAIASQDSLSELLDLIKSAEFSLKKLGAALKINLVSTSEDYASALQVRYEAYKAAAKLLDTSTLEDMADEYDQRSIILIARFKNFTVATVRLVESHGPDEKFPFETSLPFAEILPDKARTDVYEISRLAILPELQGTDLLVRLFQECSKQVLSRKNTAVCLATQATRKNYELLGWRKCSKEIPHPVLKDDTLALLRVDRKYFMRGKGVNATAWRRVIKVMADHLTHYSIIENPTFNPRIAVMGKIEELILRVRKKKKNKI